MSKALVLVAGLYVFLAPNWYKQERETNMKGSNEQWQGKKHHKQIELLAVAYVLLFSCLFIHYFFLNLFLCSYTFDIYFFQQGEHKNKPQTNWAQLDKRCGLYKIRIVLSNACQTCRPQNSVFLIEFRNSNFCEPSKSLHIFEFGRKIFCSSP